MVQSMEQNEGKRKCRGEGKDFLLILIPQRKEGRNKQTVSPGDLVPRARESLHVITPIITTPHPMALRVTRHAEVSSSSSPHPELYAQGVLTVLPPPALPSGL